MPYSSKYLDRCMERVTRAIGWERRDTLAQGEGPKRRGLGMACYLIERAGYAPFSAKVDDTAPSSSNNAPSRPVRSLTLLR